MNIKLECKDKDYYSNISDGKEEGKSKYDVTIMGKTFHDIELVNHPCEGKSCPYWNNCDSTCLELVRKLECERYYTKFVGVYCIFTILILALIGYFLFFLSGLNFWISLTIFAVGVFVFDCLCTFLENKIDYLYDNHFYKKIVKQNKKNEKKKKKLEKDKPETNPVRLEIKSANRLIQRIQDLLQKFDFGNDSDDIKQCIEKLEEIVEVIKKNPSAYSRVLFLFKHHLPEFYRLLQCYSILLQSGSEEEIDENEIVLTESIKIFLKHLNNLTVDVILEKNSVKEEFKSRAANLKDMVGGK